MSTLATTEPQRLWFIDTVARVLVDGGQTDGNYSVVDSVGPQGNMPPLHVHRHEDEVFHVVEGRLSIFMPGEHVELAAGDTVRAPRGVPHTYRVESETCRWLVFCQPAGFEEFVREISEAAPSSELPPMGRPHDLEAIAAAAAAAGIELLGPPGALPS